MSKTADSNLPGKVWLVGAGPGAADLLTLRAAKLLAEADVVLHDALILEEVLALASRAKRIPVGKRCGRHSTAQRFINQQLIHAARTHAVVVRLKGGDPMLFGRAQEEMDALADAGIDYEVVPGITAASAACAQLRVSLTRRGLSRSVALLTPRAGTGENPSQALRANADVPTLALYMASHESMAIAHELLTCGRAPETPVAIIENASLPSSRESLTTLSGLAARPVSELLGTDGPPEGAVLVMLGEVFREALAQRNNQIAPLSGHASNAA
ncbi:uroporphyrinogen-III C-methyltransferase [Methyloversatilis sp. RAC08]|uniref:uroporphyrinogen-III C-methyltransferase n=1 Tax=Methyloversatilis sp. RAC08 TaxID=1842540 RepID=UPI00083DEA7C|nr:uroporphyrinogen-III C-methyltransferase [Methyloversatilis sp. RAC08]AOF82502.1 uroporphyrinogen-III C-methyltransferase [Methyloversatilis sp. RAC08]